MIRPGADDLRFESWQGQEIFLFCKSSALALGSKQPPIQWVPRFFPGVKQCDVGHSPPSSAKVKNEWSYTSAFCLCCHDVGRGNITFLPAVFCDIVHSYHTSSYICISLQ